MELKRNLNFIDIFFMGYGHIIGAGIYTFSFLRKLGEDAAQNSAFDA